MDIHKNELSDILKYLPDINDFEPKEFDFIVCTLGFESRTFSFIKSLSENNLLKNSTIILIKYPTNIEENETNYPKFLEASSNAKKLIVINYSRLNTMHFPQLFPSFQMSGDRFLLEYK